MEMEEINRSIDELESRIASYGLGLRPMDGLAGHSTPRSTNTTIHDNGENTADSGIVTMMKSDGDRGADTPSVKEAGVRKKVVQFDPQSSPGIEGYRYNAGGGHLHERQGPLSDFYGLGANVNAVCSESMAGQPYRYDGGITYRHRREHHDLDHLKNRNHRVIMPEQPVCSPLEMKFLPEYLKDFGYATHMYSYDEADSDIIMKHNASEPLFLYMAFQNVHDPIEVPKKFEDMYSNIQNEGRRKFSGMVSALDEAVGNLTNKLSDKGMKDDTLFVFTADNGGWPLYYGNNYPLRGAKFTTYEGGTRAVGFIRGPGLHVTGKRFDGLMHAVDWLPTLVAVGGGSSPPTGYKGDGLNMWPALSQMSSSPRTELVYNIDDLLPYEQGHAAIRVGDYKLIDGYPGLYPDWYKPQAMEQDYDISEVDMEQYERAQASRYQLYNLKNDPTEHNDLSSKEPDIVSKLAARLKSYHDTMVPANYPLPDPFSSPKLHNGAWTPGWC